MAVGNTFGATALASYGGFWIGTAIILTPGGFEIMSSLEADSPAPFMNSFALYLFVSILASIMLHARNSETDSSTGMVHFHHPSRHSHPEVYRRLLFPVLHPGYGIPLPRTCLPVL